VSEQGTAARPSTRLLERVQHARSTLRPRASTCQDAVPASGTIWMELGDS
jgi:hypothetical protein